MEKVSHSNNPQTAGDLLGKMQDAIISEASMAKGYDYIAGILEECGGCTDLTKFTQEQLKALEMRFQFEGIL